MGRELASPKGVKLWHNQDSSLCSARITVTLIIEVNGSVKASEASNMIRNRRKGPEFRPPSQRTHSGMVCRFACALWRLQSVLDVGDPLEQGPVLSVADIMALPSHGGTSPCCLVGDSNHMPPFNGQSF